MAADFSYVRQTYISKMQSAAQAVNALAAQLDALNTLYLGAGLSGTFLDTDCSVNNTTKQMLAVDVGTFTSNLQTIRAAITTAIQQNMAKAAGTP